MKILYNIFLTSMQFWVSKKMIFKRMFFTYYGLDFMNENGWQGQTMLTYRNCTECIVGTVGENCEWRPS